VRGHHSSCNQKNENHTSNYFRLCWGFGRYRWWRTPQIFFSTTTTNANYHHFLDSNSFDYEGTRGHSRYDQWFASVSINSLRLQFKKQYQCCHPKQCHNSGRVWAVLEAASICTASHDPQERRQHWRFPRFLW